MIERAQQVLANDVPLASLPLVTLYLTDRCNSRCVTCDYWRHGRTNMTLESVVSLLPSLSKLGTEVVLLSGGEPLLNPQWVEIARVLRSCAVKLWLLTSGLSLAKYAVQVVTLFNAVTVSLDGTSRATYETIRGLDAFDNVCSGIRAAAVAGACVGVRVTVQRANYRELPSFVALADALGAQYVSFLPVDVTNSHAFARSGDISGGLALEPADLPHLDQVLTALERDHGDHFQRGFIAESPQKLRRMRQYFAALCGQEVFPDVRCNAPEFSAVIGAGGRLQPCFFIPGPPEAAIDIDIETMLNHPSMATLRRSIRRKERSECVKCVCSMWRNPESLAADDFLMPRRVNS